MGDVVEVVVVVVGVVVVVVVNDVVVVVGDVCARGVQDQRPEAARPLPQE